MPLITDLVGLGMPSELATVITKQTVDSQETSSVANTLTATGSTIADALLLTAMLNLITVAAASTGARLSPLVPIGGFQDVINAGANALAVYPPTAAENINGGSNGASVSLAASAGAASARRFMRISATRFVSIGQ